ncbi:endo-1,4-beta-xylanase [Flavobacterium sp. 5]|uniref:endo-1,4-beta-xylanase n=1 Tax=Flavobacterium sp. 5 TaxID=2035199 RepID=UPI000C2C6A1B|nr:endo-1,4-beta-xylanase [Flavobacterium sp. 5]PKB16396.1 carbohydrate binding protein [Flavobacterium sp. 5]
MKYNKILPAIALSCMLFTSCDDNLMDWGKDPDHGDITSAELPLELAEKISRYEPLKTYTDFKLGSGIDLNLYMNDAVYQSLVNENFDEVTLGYDMKHGPMVAANGDLKFDKIDAFIAKTKEAGLSVFGHTLVWHQNQNASYLNSLIAATIIPGSSGPSSLDLTALKAGALTGWSAWNAGAGITVVDGAGLVSGTKAVKLISSASSSSPYQLQLITPLIPIVSGHKYEISFFIKSDQTGQGRVAFDAVPALTNSYPQKDWYGTGAAKSSFFATNSSWQQVKFTLDGADFVAGSTNFKFNFDLGSLPNVTYYVDVNTIAAVDLDAVQTVTNLITNGNFESGALSPWSGYGNNSTRAISASGAGHSGNYAMVLMNPAAANNYEAQQVFSLSTPLEINKEYTCTFWVKSDVPAALQFELQGANYNADYSGTFNVTTSWTQVVKKITTTKGDRAKFIFDFGATAATFTIDDIVLTDGSTTGGGAGTPAVTIEKTDAEKATLIGGAMENWISKMVGHYKNDIHAWDVVNEPMKEGGSLRDGVVNNPAADEFYWVKYLGKDYAVTAFKLARQYGNATDKLFINDYNLEASLAKCDGLIEYVKYIESKGATVDGIGTQMHITLSTNKDQIAQMFQKLGASGKLIKVSELDIALGTKSPTLEQLANQSAMYQYVIDSYRQYIPKAQQYGITIWGVSDNVEEHKNWLTDQAPNVWDAEYKRKHAYKGVADGLAGKDVSKEFTGDIIIP